MRKLVVIEDGLLVTMGSDARFLKEFPFLASLGRQTGTKAPCCGDKTPAKKIPFNSARQAIARLPLEKKKRLCQLLNTEQCRILYFNGNTPINLTF